MNETAKRVLDGRVLKVYRSDKADAPVVYSVDFMENGKGILKTCRELGAPAFHLVTISHIHWDEDLSPWLSGPVVSKEDHFTGGADAFLRWILDEAMPYTEGVLGNPPAPHVLCGYSMAGLFAMYAAYQTDRFDAFVSASGSLWYPRFFRFATETELASAPKAIYLSIGDKESNTKNRDLQLTVGFTKDLADIYAARGLNVKHELNPGNHYRSAGLRLAKGVTWALQQV